MKKCYVCTLCGRNHGTNKRYIVAYNNGWYCMGSCIVEAKREVYVNNINDSMYALLERIKPQYRELIKYIFRQLIRKGLISSKKSDMVAALTYCIAMENLDMNFSFSRVSRRFRCTPIGLQKSYRKATGKIIVLPQMLERMEKPKESLLNTIK